MNKYWLVHIDDYDDFIIYIKKTFCDRNGFYNRDLYDLKKYYTPLHTYLYLCVDDDNVHHLTNKDSVYYLSYMNFDDASNSWFIDNNWEYMGEFNARKNKLKKLSIISKNNK
jgi:hypothetical protein